MAGRAWAATAGKARHGGFVGDTARAVSGPTGRPARRGLAPTASAVVITRSTTMAGAWSRSRWRAPMSCGISGDGVDRAVPLREVRNLLDRARVRSTSWRWRTLWRPISGPKLERYGDTLFVVLRPARYVDSTEEVEIMALHIFMGVDFVVTIRHSEAPDLRPVRRRLEQQPELLRRGPGGAVRHLGLRSMTTGLCWPGWPRTSTRSKPRYSAATLRFRGGSTSSAAR